MGDLARGLENLSRILDGSKRPGRLRLSVLSHITDNFSDNRKIGEGGCGHVYKGILPNGKMVAVKKLLNSQTMDERMFQQEVTTMMSVKHQNIVGFIGYCSHTEQQVVQMTRKHILADERERLLCFDYISKGSLEDHVTDELRGLEWHIRFQVIKGICEGLHHLHKEKNIIHMDLKPANILLNDDLVPKITDFGISRPGDTSETMSEVRMYSRQYCAPEYKSAGKMSFMSDIYSLGVIIKEMVTGSREEPNVDRVHRRWRHRLKNAKHTSLGYQQQVTKCLELGQRCINLDPTERPDILDIIGELNEIDSTCMDISDVSISTDEQQRNSFVEDMLGIEPLELHFTAEHNKQTTGSIKLTNDTDDYIAFQISLEEKKIAFGVSFPSRLPLCVHPNKDVVPPRSSCRVTITLEAVKKPLQQKHCIEEFCVMSTRVDKGVTSKNITGDMFKEEAGKDVDMVNLMVSVRSPKQLLIIDPLELRYRTIELNKPSACLVQLTNMTDNYVAFTFVLPQQGKVLYYHEAIGTGIMSPWSTRGVVVYMLVKEETNIEKMQRKDKCIVRSVVVDKGLRDDDVSVEFFDDQIGVHDMELDIVFAEQPQVASSTVPHPMFDDEQDWEEDELELLGDRAMLTSPFLIETELLHIYPAEIHFASEGGADQHISLANKTDHNVIYAINYYDRPQEEDEGDSRMVADERGVLPPQSTRVVPVLSKNKHHYYQVRVMMISGSHRYRTADGFYDNYTYDKREELMSQVRADGGKAHEVLLAWVVGAPPHQREIVATDYNKQQHQVILSMYSLRPGLMVARESGSSHKHEYLATNTEGQREYDVSGPGFLECMDVHPTEPWIVTGHHNGDVCMWGMHPEVTCLAKHQGQWPQCHPKTCMKNFATEFIQRNCTETVDGRITHLFMIQSVKFIPRMQWVACAERYSACITVFTYAHNTLTVIKNFEANQVFSPLISLAVHPTLPYLLSSSMSEDKFIQLWDWDKGWICIREFKRSSTHRSCCEMTFDPRDVDSFASVSNDDGEINVWSIYHERPTTSFRGDTVGIAYCNTGIDKQRMLATVSSTGKIEMLDLRSNTAHVQTLEPMGTDESRWGPRLITSHPTLPLLATTEANAVILWNYTSYGLKRVNTFHSHCYSAFKCLRFVDIEGFQRLVIATEKTVQIVDIFDGATLSGRPGNSSLFKPSPKRKHYCSH